MAVHDIECARGNYFRRPWIKVCTSQIRLASCESLLASNCETLSSLSRPCLLLVVPLAAAAKAGVFRKSRASNAKDRVICVEFLADALLKPAPSYCICSSQLDIVWGDWKKPPLFAILSRIAERNRSWLLHSLAPVSRMVSYLFGKSGEKRRCDNDALHIVRCARGCPLQSAGCVSTMSFVLSSGC
jgi:hypothetical protein